MAAHKHVPPHNYVETKPYQGCADCGYGPGAIFHNSFEVDKYLKENATHYVHCNSGNALFVKEAAYFEEQGGLTMSWGKAWKPVIAASIGDARRQAAKIFNVTLSHIHAGEI